MDRGYIKVYRSLQDKGYYSDPEYVSVWVHLLMKATYRPKEYLFNNRIHHLEPGQFITGRRVLARETGVNRSKLERILFCFESEQQIEQQTTNKFRIITILNWEKYQVDEQQKSYKRAASEQPVSTNKKDKKDNNKTLYSDCVYLSKEEYQKIIEKHGQNLTDKAIELLNNYIQSSGKKYKSHYHTLLLWPMQRAQEVNNGTGTNSNIGSDARPWIRRPGQELSGEAQRALDDIKRIERERAAAKLAAANNTGT
jgi:hypothetical protein